MPSALKVTLNRATKVHRTKDPSLPLHERSSDLNTAVTTWNGGSPVTINDTTSAKLAASLTSLTRTAGEDVGSWNITGGAYTLSGTSKNSKGHVFNAAK